MQNAEVISQNLKFKIKDSINLAPKLARKPKIILYWSLGARWAQLVLLLVILGMS